MELIQISIYYLFVLLVRIGEGVLYIIALLTKGISLLISRIVFLLKSIKNVILFFLKRLIKAGKTVKKYTHRLIHPKKRISHKEKRQKDLALKPASPKARIRYFFYGTFFSLLFFFIPIAIFLFLQELPSPKALTARQIPQTTKIYDRNGVLLTQIYGPQDRTIVALAEIPDNLKKATIAIEDKNFYTHPGFDVQAIIRALRENISGRSFQGASTITQQLVRSSFLTNEPDIVRKIKEIIIAFWTERIYSKDQILEMYFNQIPYGGTAWGVEAASDVYFGKHVKDLTLAESTFLAGITTAPTFYSPYGQEPNRWKMRQKEVLSQMVRLGFISKKEKQDALSETLQFRNRSVAINAPHFVNYVKDFLAQKYGLAMLERGGLTVTTSLDMTLQKKAEEITSPMELCSSQDLKAVIFLQWSEAVISTTHKAAMLTSRLETANRDHQSNLSPTLQRSQKAIPQQRFLKIILSPILSRVVLPTHLLIMTGNFEEEFPSGQLLVTR
ncbi:MAG: penicillin-binding protein [Candidatus Levybacteria bacterium]|nr:penicillin-binding protein [Candidatus Levybacteria bacterium]